MNKKEIWESIELEMRSAKKKHPNWPYHPAAQCGIIVEEIGELMQACLDKKFEFGKLSKEAHMQRIKEEAIQVAVTAIRFLENLK